MTISIVEYCDNWPDEFRKIASRLRGALGDIAIRIDHIGSTAVPGLAAKDVIDVQITVAALNDSVAYLLNHAGYTRAETIVCDHVPPGDNHTRDHWTKWFFRAPLGQRPTNTHVRVAGRRNQRYSLLFRDYLRTHPDTATAYSRLKRCLAEHLPTSDLYADVKDPAVDLIALAAEEWAVATNWEPGPSDA